MEKYVDFIEYQADTLDDIDKIHLCLNLSPAMCGEKSYCVFSNDDSEICKLQIPKTNLISGSNNEIQYFHQKYRKICISGDDRRI